MPSELPLLPHLLGLEPVPHGGAMQLIAAGLDPSRLVDFSATTLPVPTPAPVRAVLAAGPLTAYPDPACTLLCRALGDLHGLHPDHILCANGSVALIHAAARACLSAADTALIIGPTFGEYRLAIAMTGARPVEVAAQTVSEVLSAIAEHRPRLVFLCNPNNPTGHRWSESELQQICAAAFVVLDEAYAGFLRPTPAPSWGPGRLVLRSLTKDRGLASLRIGYAVASPSVLSPLSVVLTPWGVNGLAQQAALAALQNPEPYEAAIDAMWAERSRLIAAIADMGLTVTQGKAPFFLIEVEHAGRAYARLLEHGVMVRDCTSFGLPRHIRISPRTPDCGERLLGALRQLGVSSA